MHPHQGEKRTMKIYQNSYTTSEGGHAGFEWFTSKAEANKTWVARHKAGEVFDGDKSVRALTVEIGTRKIELINFLNTHANYGFFPEVSE
jgi:hypothetical protein